jgi:hypothetical protein
MSSRLHNKFHRHNHHTTPIQDPRYPDAAHDPIASADSPFQGPFFLQGNLSAVGGAFFTQAVSANIDFVGSTIGNFTVNVPATATGDFLLVNINGSPKAIRLWDYDVFSYANQ